jgi:uncharacterized membrane protein
MPLLTPFNLTPLGLFHTLVSLVAVVAALVALYRDKGISPRTSIGRTYLVSLLITTLTGFPIFRHGSVGPPHIVGAIIMVVLAVAALAAKTRVFGGASAYVETLSYSTTVFLLMIPTVTETLTRVPPSAPWVASPEAPIFPPLYAVLLVLFLVGAFLQVGQLRAAGGRVATE